MQYATIKKLFACLYILAICYHSFPAITSYSLALAFSLSFFFFFFLSSLFFVLVLGALHLTLGPTILIGKFFLKVALTLITLCHPTRS